MFKFRKIFRREVFEGHFTWGHQAAAIAQKKGLPFYSYAGFIWTTPASWFRRPFASGQIVGMASQVIS